MGKTIYRRVFVFSQLTADTDDVVGNCGKYKYFPIIYITYTNMTSDTMENISLYDLIVGLLIWLVFFKYCLEHVKAFTLDVLSL